MSKQNKSAIPVGTLALIFSKYYYGVLSKALEGIEVERYFSMLYFLSANDGCTQQHICNSLAIDKTAMVKVMDYLVKAGYVQRVVNPEDRREHFVRLTKKGKSRTIKIVEGFDLLDKQLFADISKEKKVVFMEMLTQLSDNLKTLPSNDLFFNYKKTKSKTKSL